MLVKRHHAHLQEDCHSLNEEIGMTLAKKLHSDFGVSSPCGRNVNQLKSIEKDKQQNDVYHFQLVFV